MAEELKEKAEEYANMYRDCLVDIDDLAVLQEAIEDVLSENCVQLHKITDWKNQEQFPKDETFNYIVRTKKDGDYICEWDITEGYGQFYSIYDGEGIDPEDVVCWAKIEIPQFKE